MGRWALSEYDRVLITKVKQLIAKGEEDILCEGSGDRGYRSFIKVLDPENAGVQACFRSLVQQSMYISTSRTNGSSTRAPQSSRSSRTLSIPGAGPVTSNRFDTTYNPRLRLSRSSSEESVSIHGSLHELEVPSLRSRRQRAVRRTPPASSFPNPIRSPPQRSTNLPHQHRSPAYYPYSPDPIGLTDVSAPRSSSLPQSPTPRRIHRRSHSPSYSPSRTRSMNLGLPPPLVGDSHPSVVSPPHSPSRVWLEEYNRQQGSTDGGARELGRGYLNNLLGGPEDLPERSTRRRLREETGFDEARSVSRRRFGAELEEREQALRRNMTQRDESQRRREVRHHDTRRDGVVFVPLSPDLPFPTISSAHGAGGGLFGPDSYLSESNDPPSRRYILPYHDPPDFIDFVGVHQTDEADYGNEEMASYHYIV